MSQYPPVTSLHALRCDIITLHNPLNPDRRQAQERRGVVKIACAPESALTFPKMLTCRKSEQAGIFVDMVHTRRTLGAEKADH
jgi:hypothetical protein